MAKKRKKGVEPTPPPPPNMAWLLTFADLVSLLITFFVLLYSMKVTDIDKWALVNGSFQGIFAVQKPVFQVRPDQIETVEKIDVFAADPLSYLRVLIQGAIQEAPELAGVTVERNAVEEALVVSMPAPILFLSSGSDLSRNGQRAVRIIGERLRHIDNRIEVVSHTDPFPVSRRIYPTNWELGMARALSVGRELMNMGITTPLPITTYADSRFELLPATLSRAQKLQKSRRVEIVIFEEQF